MWPMQERRRRHWYRLLDLEPIEVNIFRGISPDEDRQRIFGGQVAGQALVAAVPAPSTTTDPCTRCTPTSFAPATPPCPVSLRGRPHPRRTLVHHPPGGGDPARPADLQPVRPRFTTRSPGFEHSATPCPRCPTADELPSRAEEWEAAGRDRRPVAGPAPSPLDFRYVTASPFQRARSRSPRCSRCGSAPTARPARRPDPAHLPAHLRLRHDPARHHAVAPRQRARSDRRASMMASLDHAMWFHGPFRADEWLLYDQRTPAGMGGRGLATGRVFTHDGRLIANGGPGGPDPAASASVSRVMLARALDPGRGLLASPQCRASDDRPATHPHRSPPVPCRRTHRVISTTSDRCTADDPPTTTSTPAPTPPRRSPPRRSPLMA